MSRSIGHQSQSTDIRRDGKRIIGIVYNKTGFALVGLFHIFLLQIINLYFFIPPSFGIVSGQASGIFKYVIRELAVFVFTIT